MDAYEDGTLYPINKFYDEGRTPGGQRNVTTDYVYMRVAEMYLLHAEAAAITGDEDAARQALKTLLSERLIDGDDDDETLDLTEELAYIDSLTERHCWMRYIFKLELNYGVKVKVTLH